MVRMSWVISIQAVRRFACYRSCQGSTFVGNIIIDYLVVAFRVHAFHQLINRFIYSQIKTKSDFDSIEFGWMIRGRLAEWLSSKPHAVIGTRHGKLQTSKRYRSTVSLRSRRPALHALHALSTIFAPLNLPPQNVA
jgi:hypothetical protein